MASTETADKVDLEAPSNGNGLKRRQSETSDQEEAVQESKKQRTGPGKNPSPPEALGEANTSKDVNATSPSPTDNGTKDSPKEASPQTRRKSSTVDQKQRSKRLFGALLGSLNQPSDRTTKRRQEIESRRKAELQRQDDQIAADKARQKELSTEQRKKAQIKVDEDNMRIRHANMLDRARYLQTTAEPRLFYLPWELRPDEEDRIDEQIRDAQIQIDQEVEAFNRLHRPSKHDEPNADRPAPTSPQREDRELPAQTNEENADAQMADRGDTTPVKSATANDEVSRPAEVPDSDMTNPDTNDAETTETHGAEANGEKVEDEDGEHVVEGDEDTVIY